MNSLFNDFHLGLRTLRKSKGFTAVAVLTTTVGIAASTTVFSWINVVLLRPFPGAGDPARLVALETVAPSGEHITTSYPDYKDFRDRSRLLEGVLATHPRYFNMGEGVHATRLWGEMVSGNFFDVLRVKPALGRFFVGEEKNDTPGGHLVAVISHSLWRDRFHSNRSAVGSTIRINRYPLTIIGVAPEVFNGSMSSIAYDIWIPAMAYGEITGSENALLEIRRARLFLSLARLRPGVTIAQGRAELQSLAQRLAETYADSNRATGATIVPVWQATYGAQKYLLAPLSILMGICAVVLLIACANVTNLLLAHSAARGKEFAMRLALGAPRRRLVQRLLAETLLLAVAGSLLGLLFTDQMRTALDRLLPATSTPTIASVPVDASVLLFSEALAVAVTLIAGLTPALHATRLNLNDTLRESGRGSSGSARAHRLRSALVVAEVALAVVALAGAGLFLKSFQMGKEISPGFDPRHVAIAEVDLSSSGYTASQADVFCRRLRQDLESKPGVRAVSYGDNAPLGFAGMSWEDLQIEGYVPAASENMKIYRSLVSPGYFDLMHIPLIEGRDFTDHDDEHTLPVMVVNAEFARRFLPHLDPLRHKVNGFGRWFTIVGVAANAKYITITESPQPYFYIPIRQRYGPQLEFYVRMAGAPETALGIMRQTVAGLDPNAAVFGGETLSEHISASLFGQKVAASLMSVLGAIALLLAAIGLYSVMAYSVIQRRHEIGIRIALGARPGDMARLALHRGMILAMLGLAIGLVGALAAMRMASVLLIRVSPADPAVYAAVAAFLAVIAALANWIPARRAARVDPMESLRAE